MIMIYAAMIGKIESLAYMLISLANHSGSRVGFRCKWSS